MIDIYLHISKLRCCCVVVALLRVNSIGSHHVLFQLRQDLHLQQWFLQTTLYLIKLRNFNITFSKFLISSKSINLLQQLNVICNCLSLYPIYELQIPYNCVDAAYYAYQALIRSCSMYMRSYFMQISCFFSCGRTCTCNSDIISIRL